MSSITYSTLDSGYDFFITDKWNKKHHYKIFTFPLGIQQLSEAVEVDKTGSPLNSIQVLTDVTTDVEKAELLLKAKIKRWINRRHLKVIHGKQEIISDVVRGTLGWTNDLSDTSFNTVFEIDSKRITVENLIELLDPYGGFNFKLQLYDPSDEVD
ncbi:MAG: hypothetical protein WCY58_12995 [Mariniphaga sp.]